MPSASQGLRRFLQNSFKRGKGARKRRKEEKVSDLEKKRCQILEKKREEKVSDLVL